MDAASPKCCEFHDRMDLKQNVKDFVDGQCGVPDRNGQPHFCCRHCPDLGKPLRLQARWASNPLLMSMLTQDERNTVLAEAARLGPLYVDIRVAMPPPSTPENAAVSTGAGGTLP